MTTFFEYGIFPPLGKRTRYARMRIALDSGGCTGIIELAPHAHGPWRPAGPRLARRFANVFSGSVNGTPVTAIIPKPVPAQP